MRRTGSRPPAGSLLRQIDASVEPVGLVVGAGREEQCVVRLAMGVVAEGDTPEPGLRESAVGGLQRTEERSARGIVAVDLAVTEITDEQRLAERAEVCRRKR